MKFNTFLEFFLGRLNRLSAVSFGQKDAATILNAMRFDLQFPSTFFLALMFSLQMLHIFSSFGKSVESFNKETKKSLPNK
jgi:hypothetical protein